MCRIRFFVQVANISYFDRLTQEFLLLSRKVRREWLQVADFPICGGWWALMNSASTLRLARAGFVVFACLLGVALAPAYQASYVSGGLIGAAVGLVVVGVEVLLIRFTLGAFSSATVGLLIGMLCAWLITRLNLSELPIFQSEDATSPPKSQLFELAVYCIFGFIGIALALRANREEFALLIPYVRFRQEGVEEQQLIVDTNILIDGRLPGLCDTGFIHSKLIVPRFVLDELHLLADSPDPHRRERGRRGLDSLEALRGNLRVEVKIHEDNTPAEQPVDVRLARLARALGASLLTNDSNLGRVASLQGVTVLNLNSLAKAMRPPVIPGDEVELTLIKEGKDSHQAVGYLPDGTMLVVNHARHLLGQTVPVVISSSLQTAAGRLVFAELKPAKPARDEGGAAATNSGDQDLKSRR